MAFVQKLPHIINWDIPELRRAVRDYNDEEWRRRLRVRRIVGEITDTQWKTTLQRKEKEYHKRRALLYLMEMYYNASMDIIRQIAAPAGMKRPALQSTLDQLCELQNFVVKQNEKTAKAYGGKPQVPADLLGHNLRT